jgi:hypothetical protein
MNKCFCLFTILAFACAHERVDYRRFYDLKGKVRQVTTSSSSETETILGLMNSINQFKEILTFNEEGQLIKRETHSLGARDESFNVVSTDTFVYNNGFLEFEETFDGISNTKLKFHITRHNDRGFPLEALLIEGKLNENMGVDKILYHYKPDSFEKLSFEKDLMIDRYTATYDEDLNVITEKLEWLYDQPDSPTVFLRKINYLKFDDQGNWIKRVLEETTTQTSTVEERQITYF